MRRPARQSTTPATEGRWHPLIVFVLALVLAAAARCDQQVPLGVDPGLDAAAPADAGAGN